MFRSHRNPYYSRRKRRFPGIWQLLAMVIAGLILLELLTWALLSFTGYGQTVEDYDKNAEVVYQLKFLNQNEEQFTGLDSAGQLLAQKNGAQGYTLLPQESSDFWQINEQGFRESAPLPLEKPEQEKRIFLVGGSTAFGQGSEGNAKTIASFLETRLQERLAQQERSPEKYRPRILPIRGTRRIEALQLPPKILPGKYNVINAAVPGYASGNVLAQLALTIFPYEPDAIILLGGYDDLTLPDEQDIREIPRLDYLLNHPARYFWMAVTQPVQDFFTNTNIFQTFRYVIFPEKLSVTQKTLAVAPENEPLADYFPQDEEQLAVRLNRYQKNIQQLTQLCAGANIPLVVALQPEITGVTPEKQQQEEQEIMEQLSEEYIQRVQQGFTRLGEVNDQLGSAFPNNIKTLNYYSLYNDLSAVAFRDPIHLTEAGNKALAERFYNAITRLPDLQVESVTPER
ncbi:hypothetical protein PN462_15600 [Spirulina sp. CS-785/01]|uniref:SGNH/GDSL hydrolase family protein n=1 Tax=Spirulina sp. CS-785/01 TaxID=3021716 RepID=UPI00232AE055|nr:SGNH/GDSL hydrolase family protein [Spirulina sp. CS-785/01]MDB9314536.1 hypothetical protein [Spirulina sp. CS-785/01]